MGVQLKISEHVATMTIESSERGDLIDFETAYSLSDAASEIRQRDDVWVAVLDADRDDFCLGTSPDVVDAVHGAGSTQTPLRVGQTLADIEKPVLCALRGGVQDQGLEIALACDARIADSDATFAMSQVLSGAMPWDGGTQRLPRLIGRSRAMDMLLTGRRVSAEEALGIGLINEVVEPGKATERAMELASVISRHGPIALRFLKEAVLNGMDGTLEQGLRLEADLSFLLQSTQDRSEGISSFLERRSPTYRGQ